MEAYKNEILAHLLSPSNANSVQQNQLDKIYEGISYAWTNWVTDITDGYYKDNTQEKPAEPQAEFITDWITNEDFEADGYDVEYLKEIFA